MLITKRHLSRRTVLRGMGVTMALPFLEVMMPTGRAYAKTAAAARKVRFSAIEMVHGAAGSDQARSREEHVVAGAGRTQLRPQPEQPEAARGLRKDYITIVSNTDVRNAEAFELPEIGADHFRSSAVFLTQTHPHQTQGSNVRAGTSIDQMYAQKFGQETPIPSMQLCIENVDQAGGCAYGYSCVYTDTISWATPTQPLPMVRDPRAAFDQLFGVGATAAERSASRRADASILDWISAEVTRLRKDLGAADRARLSDYLENVREIERRIQKVEAYNSSGEQRDMPEAPMGVPDSFSEHVKLMFDLQVLAFQSDTTRVFSFKMGRDGSSRVYPESGVNLPFHPASHHGEREERVTQFAKINEYHVGLVPYFLEKLKNTPDGDTNLLENTLIVYGSPMGNSNVHNHKRCPLFLAGHAGGALKGGVHIKTPDGTPMANAFLSRRAGRARARAQERSATARERLDLNGVQDTTVA